MTETPPDRYAVMGHPVAHSLSPRIHALFARQTGQAMVYTAIYVEKDRFAQALDEFQAGGGKGLNVTLPFKHEAWTLCQRRSARAERARAVNTLMFQPDATRYGDNTDGAGLVRDLLVNHGAVIAGRRVLLLGAGGAAWGVLAPLLEQRPARLRVANRTAEKATALAREFSDLGPVEGGGLNDLGAERFDLIINATAASLQGEVPPLPDSALTEGGWCYDMMYGAAPTPFLRWARAHGAGKAVDGLGMLVEQAAESFYLWRDVKPHTAPVIAAVRKEFFEVISKR